MNPDTTPAPMTHEVPRYLINRAGKPVEHPEGTWVYVADWEAERTRADALAAKCAELEAGIGRLADEWEAGPAKGYPHMRPCDLEANAQARRCADELRSLIGHKEGRGNG